MGTDLQTAYVPTETVVRWNQAATRKVNILQTSLYTSVAFVAAVVLSLTDNSADNIVNLLWNIPIVTLLFTIAMGIFVGPSLGFLLPKSSYLGQLLSETGPRPHNAMLATVVKPISIARLVAFVDKDGRIIVRIISDRPMLPYDIPYDAAIIREAFFDDEGEALQTIVAWKEEIVEAEQANYQEALNALSLEQQAYLLEHANELAVAPDIESLHQATERLGLNGRLQDAIDG